MGYGSLVYLHSETAVGF